MHVTQLPEKKRNEKAVAKVRVVHEVVQAATEKKKATKAVAAAQIVEATIAQAEEGLEVSAGHEVDDTYLAKEGANPGTTSTQLKRSCIIERSGPWKKVKGSKLAIHPITLMEGDLYDTSEMVLDVTKEALQEVMMEQQTVLGALRAQL